MQIFFFINDTFKRTRNVCVPLVPRYDSTFKILTYKRPVDWFSVGEDIDYRFGVQGVIVPLHQSPGLEHTIYHNALTRVSQFVCSPGGSIHTTTSKI